MATYSQAKPAGTPTWIDLMSSDVEASRNFYHTLFGWDYDIAGPEFGGYTTALLHSHGVAGLSGFPEGQEFPVAWSLYFASHDIEADSARAVELGANVLVPAFQVGNFGSMATLADPTGALFSFWQADTHIGAGIMEEPGSTTWFELYTTDVKRARDFYAALLNATVDTMPGDMEYYFLKHGDKQLCGIMQIEPSWGDFPPQWATYFLVSNTDESAGIITSNGGKILGDIEDTPYGRMASVVDPHGATFKIIQEPDQ